MQTCRLRAARGRGTAAYPQHPRSCAPGLHRLLQTRRPGTDRARLSGRARPLQRASRARGPQSRDPRIAFVARGDVIVRDAFAAVRSSVRHATPAR
jgi:hypothetical protein